MALSVNGKELNLSDKDNVSTKHYLACIKELMKYCGGAVRIKFSRESRHPSTGAMERPNSIWWENREMIRRRLSDGTIINEDWIYYDSKSPTDKDGIFKYYVEGNNKGVMKREYMFTEDSMDMDKLFFLVFISPRCELITDNEKLMRLQNIAKQNVPKFFKIYNEHVQVREDDFLEEQKYNVLKFLRETATETQIRVIAEKDCLIANASQEDIVKLKTLVTKYFTEHKDRLRAFDASKYSKEMVELRNTLNEARDMEVLRYIPTSRSFNIIRAGEKNIMLCQLPKDEKYKSEINRLQFMYDLCKENNTVFNQVRDAVEQRKVDIEADLKRPKAKENITQSLD